MLCSELYESTIVMKKKPNASTLMILVIASILAIVLGLLDHQTDHFTQLFMGDSGANLIALILYTSIFALIISFFRVLFTRFSQVSEEAKP